MRFNCLLLALLILPALCSAAAAAAPAGNAQKEELRQLRGRIDALQKRLAASEETKSETVDALRESERAISETNRALRELAGQQRAVNAQLAELQGQSDRTAADIDAQQARLARLLYQQYVGAQPDALKLLLNREDPNRIARELHYLTHLSRARAELIRGLRINLGRLNELARATQQHSAELAAIHAEQQVQRRRLEAEKRARRQVLVKVSRQIEKQRREISTLKRDENRLSRLVEQLSRMLSRARPRTQRNERLPDASGDGSPFTQLKGRLSLPVRGELKNRFGSPREDSGLSWKGLFIAAPVGQEVKAIAAGRVVFADWLRGFGNLLIVDHGGGYMSLYGNNESLYKQVGEATRGGETVAAVGNSGGNTDSGLYFEIRHQGKAFDPLGWVNLK
ncbi:MAG: peptidoglycan DD-metalloendopeptidase family protein [Betaproteobacteria bacterium]|nr:peptidoglycan DD-metalloendopeptidase family protein [Betaproteobacteria bacterium]